MLGFTPNRSLHKSVKSMYARLIVFFSRCLYQVGLSNRYYPEEILSEAVLCLGRTLKMNNNVYNHEAWLRKAGFLYIREILRDEGKFGSNVDVDVDTIKYSNGVEQLESEETCQLVNEVILMLYHTERELLEMRFYNNMSWDEIVHFYASQGKVISIPALRQRGSRAIKSLRKVFIDQLRLAPSDKLDV